MPSLPHPRRIERHEIHAAFKRDPVQGLRSAGGILRREQKGVLTHALARRMIIFFLKESTAMPHRRKDDFFALLDWLLGQQNVPTWIVNEIRKTSGKNARNNELAATVRDLLRDRDRARLTRAFLECRPVSHAA